MNLGKTDMSKILRKLDKVTDYHSKAEKELNDIKDIISGISSNAKSSSKRRSTPKKRDDHTTVDDDSA